MPATASDPHESTSTTPSSPDRDIIRLAIPALGSLAAEPTYLLVDTAVIGHLGTRQLAALGLAATFLSSLFWLFNFLANATTTHVANAHGADDDDSVGSITAQALWLALGIGVALTAFGLLFASDIVSLLQARGKVAEHAAVYIRISALGAVPVMVVLAAQGWARGIQRLDIPLKILISSNVLNLILELLFIYGFGWGIAGSAWGTVIAQTAAALAFLHVLRPALVGRARALWSRMRPLLVFGGDLFVRTGLMLICFNVVNALLARQGATPLAANQMLFQLMIFLALVMDSLAVSAQTLIGGELGADRPAPARVYARRVAVLSLYAGLAIAAVLAAVNSLLPQAFTSDAAVLHEVSRVWWLFVVYVIFSSLVYGWDGVLLGGGDSRAMMLIMVVAAACTLPTALLLITDAADAIVGAWVAFSVLNGARLIGNGWRVHSGRWAGSTHRSVTQLSD